MFELELRDGRQDSFKQNARLAHFSVWHNIPYVSSVSKLVIGRKLEREQNLFFFYSRPNLLDELAWKLLLRNLFLLFRENE